MCYRGFSMAVFITSYLNRTIIYMNRFIIGNGNDFRTIVIVATRPNLVRVLIKSVDTLPGGRVPDFDSLIGGTRREMNIVRAEGNIKHPGGVSAQCMDKSCILHIVYFDLAVIRGRDQTVGVRREG